MDVRLRLAKSSTNHNFSPVGGEVAVSVGLLPVGDGGTFGGMQRFGGIDAWGNDIRLHYSPPLRHSPSIAPYLLELAHEANSYIQQITYGWPGQR